MGTFLIISCQTGFPLRPSNWSQRARQTQCQRGLLNPAGSAERLLAVDATTESLQLGSGLREVDVACPVHRQRNRRWCQRERRHCIHPPAETAPGPRLSRLGQAGTQCVSLDVANDGQQVIVRLHRKCLESPLPDAAARSAGEVIPTHMRRQQPVHPGTQIGSLTWPHQQVKVIRHQADSKHLQFNARLRLVHQLDELTVIGSTVKHASTIVAAIDHVIALTTYCRPGCSWHTCSVLRTSSASTPVFLPVYLENQECPHLQAAALRELLHLDEDERGPVAGA